MMGRYKPSSATVLSYFSKPSYWTIIVLTVFPSYAFPLFAIVHQTSSIAPRMERSVGWLDSPLLWFQWNTTTNVRSICRNIFCRKQKSTGNKFSPFFPSFRNTRLVPWILEKVLGPLGNTLIDPYKSLKINKYFHILAILITYYTNEVI